jgi:hypothetical protein
MPKVEQFHHRAAAPRKLMCSDVTDTSPFSTWAGMYLLLCRLASGSMFAASIAAKALQFFLERLHVPLSRPSVCVSKELR